MPEGYSTRLEQNNPGVLRHSLVDELPVERANVEHVVIDDPDEDFELPFNPGKLFNVIIYDDGPTESYGSHSASTGAGTHDDTPYLEAMFERGLAQNEVLTSGKLLLLMERYMGESVQLPAHEGVDDTVYGSLAVYRQEIVEELACWASNHSVEELDAAVMKAISSLNHEQKKSKYRTVWEDIRYELD